MVLCCTKYVHVTRPKALKQEAFTRCCYCRTPAIAIAQAACDVHDNNDDNNDNT